MTQKKINFIQKHAILVHDFVVEYDRKRIFGGIFK